MERRHKRHPALQALALAYSSTTTLALRAVVVKQGLEEHRPQALLTEEPHIVGHEGIGGLSWQARGVKRERFSCCWAFVRAAAVRASCEPSLTPPNRTGVRHRARSHSGCFAGAIDFRPIIKAVKRLSGSCRPRPGLIFPLRRAVVFHGIGDNKCYLLLSCPLLPATFCFF